jgi:hypothetical protein
MVLTLHLCILYGSQIKQQLLPYKTLRDWFYVTEVDCGYSAVRAVFVYNRLPFAFKGLKNHAISGKCGRMRSSKVKSLKI